METFTFINMRYTLYDVLAMGLFLFIPLYAHTIGINDCKPYVYIQPVDGYTPQLNGDIETLEKFILKLAEVDVDYCKASLRIDFNKGLEIKQAITRGELRYNEKLFLEVQFYSPSYKAIIESEKGDILLRIELGRKLKSIKYSNAKLNNHDELYSEWRQISRDNLSQIEKDVFDLQALIDFLKIEIEMSDIVNSSLEFKEKEEELTTKMRWEDNYKSNIKKSKEVAESSFSSVRKEKISRVDSRSNSSLGEVKKDTEELLNPKFPSDLKNSNSKLEVGSDLRVQLIETFSSELILIKSIVKESASKPTRPKVNFTIDSLNENPKKIIQKGLDINVKHNLPVVISAEFAKAKENPSKDSFETTEVISEDHMFEDFGVAEPLAEMIRFQFLNQKNYVIINESDFSVRINLGRESGRIFENKIIKPKHEKKLRNKFKSGDWYSIVYPERAQEKDIKRYKNFIESILTALGLINFEDEFFEMSEQLIPNLSIIPNENPLTDSTQIGRVDAGFQKFIDENGIQVFNGNQQTKAITELKSLLILTLQSHQIHHYYKYTVGDSVLKRPINKLPKFRKK